MNRRARSSGSPMPSTAPHCLLVRALGDYELIVPIIRRVAGHHLSDRAGGDVVLQTCQSNFDFISLREIGERGDTFPDTLIEVNSGIVLAGIQKEIDWIMGDKPRLSRHDTKLRLIESAL